MITRNVTTTEVFNFQNQTVKTINTSGYKSAKIVIDKKVIAGNYGSATFNLKDSKGNILTLFGERYNTQSYFLSSATKETTREEFVIDLSKTETLKVEITNNAYFINSGELRIFFSYEEINPSDYKHETLTLKRSETETITKTFQVTGEFMVLNLNVPKEINYIFTIYLKGKLKGGTDYEILNYYKSDGVRVGSGFIQFLESQKIWSNVANYESIKLEITSEYRETQELEIDLKFTDKLNRKIILPLNVQMSDFGSFHSAKITFDNYHYSIKKYGITAKTKNKNNEYVLPILKDLKGKVLNSNQRSDILFDTNSFQFLCLGEKINGGFVLDYGKNVFPETFAFSTYAGEIIEGATPTQNGSVFIELFSDEYISEITEEKEVVLQSREKYDVIGINIQERIVDALGEDILTKVSENIYRLYRLGFDGWNYEIPINSTYIPSLLSGETVRFVRLVKAQGAINTEFNRVCLFTNKNRILYNHIKDSFVNYFREAPVYNSEKKFHAVNTKAKASATAKYLPIFPDYDYNQFDGRISVGTVQNDVFGEPLPFLVSSNGFLLEDFKTDNAFTYLADSSFVNSKFYGTIWGTYNIVNAEPCLLASSGGKEWTIIKWFGSVSEFDMNQITTLKVDLSTIISNAGGYVSGNLKVKQRKYINPSSVEKEPSTAFEISSGVSVTDINVVGNETIITVSDETLLMPNARSIVEFSELSPIVFFEKVSGSNELDYITNNVDANGNNNSGIFFRLKRVALNQFKLFAMIGNPYEAKSICRHIHSVSEYQIGFVITTGENYRNRNGNVFFEGGFIYLIEANNRNNIATNEYTHLNVKISYFYKQPIRLTSSEKGVNRACGAFLMSDINSTLLYVSDSLENDNRMVLIDGRTPINISVLGVYKVALKDIDDINKINCVAETYNPAIGLTENNGRFAVSQFAGNAIFSSDFGETWHEETLPTLQKGLPMPSPFYGGMVNGTLDDGSFFYLNTKISFK